MEGPLVLIVHADLAWLCRRDWNRPVERDEFIAWAAYAGLELRPIEESKSLQVVLSTKHQEVLFDLMWVNPTE
jgi:hypothetical protein